MPTKSYSITLESNAFPQKHEIYTAQVLAKTGTVRFIAPSRVRGVHTPDIIWHKLRWELKAPQGKGKFLIHNTISRASRQSDNVIIDLYRCKIHEPTAIRTIKKYAPEFKRIKNLKIITKARSVIDVKP